LGPEISLLAAGSPANGVPPLGGVIQGCDGKKLLSSEMCRYLENDRRYVQTGPD